MSILYGKPTGFPTEMDINVNQRDSTNDALKVVDYSHAELHSGDHFMYRRYHTILKNGTLEHVVITPDTERWAHFTIGVEAVTSSVTIALYEGATYATSGTQELVSNRNRNYADDATTEVWENPTGLVTSGATLLATYFIGAGKNSNGGGSRDTEEILLKQNTVYALVIQEQNIQSTEVNIVFDWYEHTNK